MITGHFGIAGAPISYEVDGKQYVDQLALGKDLHAKYNLRSVADLAAILTDTAITFCGKA